MAFAVFASITARAGWIEERDGKTIIHVKVFALPDPTRQDTPSRADAAVVREFVRQFPRIFRERYRDRYRQHPEIYGRHNWDEVEIELHSFTGITIQNLALDARPLMAIAGGVAPDILYVNFRQSDTYIQQRFLYPLDRPEDLYLSAMSAEELAERIHPKIWPVIRRKGPDGVTRVWALPYGGALGKVVLFRKDLFDAAGVPYPDNDWTWDDLLRICQRLSDPARGIYALGLGRGPHESWYWVNFLWSAGGEVLEHDTTTDTWRATFDSPAAVEALDFYTRLSAEPWTDKAGRRRYGYAYKEPDKNVKWERGEIGMVFEYIDEKLFATINPDLTGMVPVPRGPDGRRGAELNSRMMGLFAGIEHPAVRDAAWEYMRFFDSDAAMRTRVRIMVEGGLGRFINPRYLERYGYAELVRFAPAGWKECFEIAVATGRPEPYGRNCQLVYNFMTEPLQRAEVLMLRGELPADPAARKMHLARLLSDAATRANRKMLGLIPSNQLRRRRATAALTVLVIILALSLPAKRALLTWSASSHPDSAATRSLPRAQRAAWIVLLLPALLTLLVWRYWPLLQGALIAFLDYRVLGASRWVGLDNFANVLWDEDWWMAVWNSLRYSVLTVSLTFIPPLLLAILLQEVPRGNVLFRMLFYLPAVMSSVVVVLLWRSFYDPTESGALNALLLHTPVVVFLLVGATLFFLAAGLARRLHYHGARGAALTVLAIGIIMAFTGYSIARPVLQQSGLPFLQKLFMALPEPIRWLQDPNTAMLACVVPFVWAGLGPGSLVYLAALKTIPDDLYEAADMDGATFSDKILFVVFPSLKTLLLVNFLGVFIHSWLYAAGNVLAMTGGAAQTEVADLHIFYQAYIYLRFGPAAAMAWILGLMLVAFTVQQLRMLSRVEFTRAAGVEGGRV